MLLGIPYMRHNSGFMTGRELSSLLRGGTQATEGEVGIMVAVGARTIIDIGLGSVAANGEHILGTSLRDGMDRCACVRCNKEINVLVFENVGCAREGCPYSSYDGNPTSFCGRACRDGRACVSRVHTGPSDDMTQTAEDLAHMARASAGEDNTVVPSWNASFVDGLQLNDIDDESEQHGEQGAPDTISQAEGDGTGHDITAEVVSVAAYDDHINRSGP